ncbi:MAG: GNAT family N-acetyltransferase [Sphingomonadales bacterium]|nr:GNAT family N-acetyltransferase [Sphingomonadales bacterium]
MQIRETSETDIARLAAVERASAELFRNTHLEWAIEDEPLAPAAHRRAIEQGTHWIAVEGEAIAGFCCAHAMARTLYIDELAVAMDYQRRGVGRRLMETAIAAARGSFPAVSLITDRKLPWNRPFYESLGFKEWRDPEAGLRAELAEEEADGFDALDAGSSPA